MNADIRAGSDRRQHRRLGKDLGIGSDADLKVLRPQALLDQHLLDLHRLRRPRLDGSQVLANQRHHLFAHGLGPRRISPRLLFDDALDQARSKGHARRFNDLQIAGRKQKRLLRIEAPTAAVADQFLDRWQSLFPVPL